MKTCYKCGTDVKVAKSVKEGVALDCLKCPKCGEEYFTSSELIKFDIKTGKRKMVRKFGTLGGFYCYEISIRCNKRLQYQAWRLWNI